MPPTESNSPTLDRNLSRMENWGRVSWLMFRGVIGWRFAAAVVFLGGIGFYFADRAIIEPSTAHQFLGRLFAIFALILASPLLPDERSRGTLEILWMACGSLRRLLRWKTTILVLGVGVCAIPATIVASWYLNWQLNVGLVIVFLLTQTFLVAAWTFYVGSYLPQPWAGGVVAAALFLVVEWPLSGSGGLLNPFVQIYTSTYEPMKPLLFLLNRTLVVALGWFLYDQTARRVRSWLQ